MSAAPGVVLLAGGAGGEGDDAAAVVSGAVAGAAAGSAAAARREAEWMEAECRAAEAAAFVRCAPLPALSQAVARRSCCVVTLAEPEAALHAPNTTG